MRKNIRNVSRNPSTETRYEVSRTMPSVGLTADYLSSVATETDHTRQLGNKAYTGWAKLSDTTLHFCL